MEKEKYTDLVERMKGKDTTQGWDILISYDGDKVNDLLNADPIPIFKEWPKFSGEGMNEDSESVKFDFDIKTNGAILTLRNQEGRAQLAGDLSGSYRRANAPGKDPIDLISGYKLVVKVDLYNVQGKVSASGAERTFTADRTGGERAEAAVRNNKLCCPAGWR